MFERIGSYISLYPTKVYKIYMRQEQYMLLHKDRKQFIAILNAVSNFQKTRVEYDKAIEAVKKVIELDIF